MMHCRRKTWVQFGFSFAAVTAFIHFILPFLHFQKLATKREDSDANPADTLSFNNTHNHMFKLKEFIQMFPSLKLKQNISEILDLREIANDSHVDVNQPCEFPPKDLRGREKVHRTLLASMKIVEKLHQDVQDGGHFSPSACVALATVAIVVPYRDREQHLRQLLFNLIPKLKRQNLDFTIYVIEQRKGTNFNRAMLRNIGFNEAQKINNYSCVIFNDVDTIPEDDRNIYMCSPDIVRHFVTGLDREKYTLPYRNLIGGIIGFTPEQFYRINGYSNLYFQWGAEDDDLCRRIMKAGLQVKRPPVEYGLITTLPHKQDPKLIKRMKMYRTVGSLAEKDGLNSLRYKTLGYKRHKLYTWIHVDINEEEVMKEYNSIPQAQLASKKEDKACSPIRF